MRISRPRLFSLLVAATAVVPPSFSSMSAQGGAQEAAQVLAANCVSCHNRINREGQFNLQTHSDLLRGGAGGQVLVPGDPDESRMMQMVEGMLEPVMPENGALLDEDIEILRAWIEAGSPAWEGELSDINLQRLPIIQPLAEVQSAVTSLAYSGNGKWLAIGRHGSVALVDVVGGTLHKTFEHDPGAVRDLAFGSEDRRILAVGGQPGRYGEIRIWDIQGGEETQVVRGHRDAIYAVALHPTQPRFATAGYDNAILIWSTTTGAQVSSIAGHVDAVYDLAFSPGGDRLVSASADRSVKVWDWAEQRQVSRPMSQSTAELYCLALNPSGDVVAAAGVDKMIRMWSLSESGGTLLRSAFAHDASILDLAFTPDGRTLISSGSDRQVKLWNVETLEEIRVLPDQSDWVLAVAVRPDGKELALGRYDGSLQRIPLQASPLQQQAANR